MYGYAPSGSAGMIGASRSTNTVLNPSSLTTFASPRAIGCFAMAPSTRSWSSPRLSVKPTSEPAVAHALESKAPCITPPKSTPDERASPIEMKSSRNTLATIHAPRNPSTVSGPRELA